ncbi:MAG: NUDIX domain-containing protein [Bacilli bacterium]|nr:NUDIX domain-containing protein [Bacilli bacterium]
MPITMHENNNRFNCRTGAILYNEDKTKIILENQENKRLVFPGGRIDIGENSKEALERELKEELNIEVSSKLKFILELFLKKDDRYYHEVGFYYIAEIEESEIKDNLKSLDSNGSFNWFSIEELNYYDITATPIKEKIINKKIPDNIEHIIYKNY